MLVLTVSNELYSLGKFDDFLFYNYFSYTPSLSLLSLSLPTTFAPELWLLLVTEKLPVKTDSVNLH